jgi:hypothetical protein
MAKIHFLSAFMSGTFTIESARRTVAGFCKLPTSATISTSIHIKRNKTFFLLIFMSIAFIFPRQFITIFNVLLRHGPTAAFINSTCSICVVLCFIYGVNVQWNGSENVQKPLRSNIVALKKTKTTLCRRIRSRSIFCDLWFEFFLLQR